MIFKHSAFADGTDNVSFTVTGTSLQGGSDASALGKISPYNYASFELDSYDIDNPRPLYVSKSLGYSTAEQSDANGNFTTPITITADIGSAIAFSGISIGTDCILTNVKISTYNSDTLVGKKEFGNSDSINYFVTKSANVSKVIIEINSISEPNRFLDIFSIDFGRVFIFEEIKEPKMINQFSVSGRELPIDTLDLTLLNIPEDLLLDYQQKLEIINDNGKTEYVFYLDTYEYSEDNKSVKISYNDCVSLLEEQFVGGYYENATVQYIVSEILEDTDLVCEMDSTVAETAVSGYIPVTTKRNAFIYLANATGYKITKHPNLRIFVPRDFDYATFDDSNVFLGTVKKVAEKPSKEVDLSLFTYEDEYKVDGDETIYEDDFKKGDYEIIFDKPISTSDESHFSYTTSVTGALDESSIRLNNNSCKFRVVSESHLTFEALIFLISKSVVAKIQIENAELYKNYSIQKIDSFTIMIADYQSRLKQLLDYYSVNETISAKVLWNNPQLDGYIRFYGGRKQVKKITTSFTEAVEIEVETIVE